MRWIFLLQADDLHEWIRKNHKIETSEVVWAYPTA